jgi:hypothetical protein
MSKETISACLAGLLASGLFIIVFDLGLGFIFMFIPTLPVFYIGLSRRPGKTPVIIIIAMLIITVVSGPAPALTFLLLMALPAWYMAKKSLLSHIPASGQIEWYPVGKIILNLTLYACIAVALITLFYTHRPGGLPGLLSQNIREAFTDMESDYGDIINTLASNWAFLMFPITMWLWGMILYAHAWLTNRVLVRNNAHQRPDLSIRVFTIPTWMLSLMAISALASLIGSPSMSFLGKSTLLSLLLPYFFLGTAIMHSSGKSWPSHRFFLFFVYFMVFTQFWPALMLSAVGLWHQIKNLNKHLSGAGNSSSK